jgi:hypothetical protein
MTTESIIALLIAEVAHDSQCNNTNSNLLAGYPLVWPSTKDAGVAESLRKLTPTDGTGTSRAS